MPKGDNIQRRWDEITPEKRKEFSGKLSKATKKRWDEMSPEEEIAFRKARSKGMKRAWKRKSKEEKAATSIRMSIKRYAYYMRLKGASQEEIDAFTLEKFGTTEAEQEAYSAARREKTWTQLTSKE